MPSHNKNSPDWDNRFEKFTKSGLKAIAESWRTLSRWSVCSKSTSKTDPPFNVLKETPNILLIDNHPLLVALLYICIYIYIWLVLFRYLWTIRCSLLTRWSPHQPGFLCVNQSWRGGRLHSIQGPPRIDENLLHSTPRWSNLANNMNRWCILQWCTP